MEAIDETILNDDNDEDLDYDLDPREENALLQEETDFLEQEFEDEDVLDINVDYDQMDVADDKLDSASSDKSISEKKLRRGTEVSVEKRKNVQIFKNEKSDKLRYLSRVHKRGTANAFGSRMMRRSKTVLINPRFKGAVQVDGRQLAWETPPPILNEGPNNQQYIQPWSSGCIPGQTVQPPQMHINNYNSPSFPPNNSYMYMQHQMVQPQTFVQPQVIMNPPPMMNQPQLLNHNMIPQQPALQMDHCTNHFQAAPIPQMETIQQIPEPSKLPVHQRLGFPTNNFNQHSNDQISYNNNQHFHNQTAFENHQYKQFNQTPFNQHDQMTNVNQPHTNNQYSNKRFDNLNNSGFNRKQNKKFAGNQGVINNGNNKVLMSTRKANYNMQVQKPFNAKNSKQNENIHTIRIENSSNIVVVPENEDEETRQYRIKIEEQKRKREEVLRKKEENRLKNMSDVNSEVPTSTVVQKRTKQPVRVFQQKKFNYQQRPQQNYQFVKPQVNSNNIVITGNDDQCHFSSRNNKIMGTYNKDFKIPSVRIVTAGPVSSSNINSKTDKTMPFDKEVDNKSLSSFLSNRIVSTQDNLMQTNIVVVKNLATATTKPKIMKLCRGIGTVQKLQMETNERQAIIHFDTIASAHSFYNKYRRYMIDLSMVQVDLVPCEGSS